MPMIIELLRPLLRVLFWRRWRPWAALAALIIGLFIAGRLAGCDASHPATPPAASAGAAPATATATATPTAAAPPAAAATPPGALADATAFLAAWAGRAPGRDAAIEATATSQLAQQLTGPAATQEPATAVTGPLRVTGQAPGQVTVSASTNAGPAVVILRLSGGRWLAAAVTLTSQGD
jgi:hypothetical protein